MWEKSKFLKKQAKIGFEISDSKFKVYTTSVAIFVFAFLMAFLAASTLSRPMSSSAESGDSTSSATADGYSLSVSATSSVNMNLSVGDSDTMTVSQGNVTVATTSPGYRLYISMNGDSTNLTNVKDLLSSTIVAISGTIGNPAVLTRGTWGYAIPSGTAHLVSNNFSSSYSTTTSTTPDSSKLFAVPPVASGNPALLASSTSSTTGDTYQVYYAIQANSDTAPGNYTNNIAFTAVADAGSTETMTLAPSSIEPNTATTVTVATTMYSTADYLEATITLGNTTLSCARISSAPLTYSCTVPATSAGTYTITLTSSKYTKTYTANLEVVSPRPSNFFEVTTMQEMTTELCATATKPLASATLQDTTGAYAGDTRYVPTITLLDDRTDGAANTKYSYTVKKLADGNCWMTENLRLVGPFTPSSADSDVESGSTFTLTASNSGTWCRTNSSDCDNQSMVLDSGNASYGTYYNWYAATAGTGTYATGANAGSSICPKGWRLPTGGSSGEFQALYDAGYNTDALMRKTTGGPAFVLSGIRHGETGQQGRVGYYWSSTEGTDYNAHDLYLSTSGVVSPARVYDKFAGLTVRCLAQ